MKGIRSRRKKFKLRQQGQVWVRAGVDILFSLREPCAYIDGFASIT
jgi:hypothetical protein